jgi:phosphinothricin acetyltransferase
MAGGVEIRGATELDLREIREIYAFYIANSLATFEESVPTLEEMTARYRSVVTAGLPFLVAAHERRVVGYAYATSYRARVAYRYAIENSVYVASGMHRQGIGARLLGELISKCEQGPWRQMIAVIGDPASSASTALHRQAGFRMVGILNAVGFKLGQWVDTALMQRDLGQGPSSAPD